MKNYSAERGRKTSPMASAHQSDKVLREWDRIERSLRKSDHWSNKRFWEGYNLGLAEAGAITMSEHSWLTDNIDLYEKREARDK